MIFYHGILLSQASSAKGSIYDYTDENVIGNKRTTGVTYATPPN